MAKQKINSFWLSSIVRCSFGEKSLRFIQFTWAGRTFLEEGAIERGWHYRSRFSDRSSAANVKYEALPPWLKDQDRLNNRVRASIFSRAAIMENIDWGLISRTSVWFYSIIKRQWKFVWKYGVAMGSPCGKFDAPRVSILMNVKCPCDTNHYGFLIIFFIAIILSLFYYDMF